MISIIIPVYNTAKYFPKCLDSILAQDCKNYEVIIIDDGSTDDTLEICNKYKKDHAKIKVYHTENLGVSNARNLGVEKASGDYAWFVDSDDIIMKGSIGTIEKELIDVDMLVFGLEEFDKRNKRQICFSDAVIGREETIKRMLSDNDIRGYLFNKIFSVKKIKENNICFSKDIKVCEDLLFSIEYMKKSEKAKIISDILYCYRQRVGGAVHSKINEKQATAIKAFEKIVNICKNEENNIKAKALFVKAFYKYRPLLSEKDKRGYIERTKLYKTDRKKFCCKDKTLILGYKFLHPIMVRLHNRQTNGKELYD